MTPRRRRTTTSLVINPIDHHQGQDSSSGLDPLHRRYPPPPPSLETVEHAMRGGIRTPASFLTPSPGGSMLFPSPNTPLGGRSLKSKNSFGTLNTLDTRSSTPLVSLPPQEPNHHTASFWLVFGALCVTTFLSALDTTSFSTALPTIVSELKGSEFIWVGIAYTMASTATLPMTGGLAEVFGRKPVMMGALGLFLIGSIICGVAKSMAALIVGRAVQGIGGGGISSLSEIIISDLVPLNKRGLYTGIVSAVWALASAVGPPVGGAFSELSWRWLFYMNIPLTLVAFTLVYCFLDLRQPRGQFKQKLKRMDWTGSFIIIGSSSLFVIALSNSPILPWGMIPLSTAIVGFFVFFWYEARVAERPTIPLEVVRNRTSLSGYLTTFFHAIASSAIIFYMPAYFQSAKMKSPTQAGVAVFGSVFSVTPAAIICGVSVAVIGKYRPQNFIGWLLCIAGFALLSTLQADSPPAQWIGYQILTGLGIGFLYSSPKFAILAPLPIDKSANALAFFSFVRKFSGIWGITLGDTILNAQLARNLPPVFLAMLDKSSSTGADIAYSTIPRIPSLPEPLRTEVRVAFAQSIRWIWLALIAVCGAGFLSTFLMEEITMHEETDTKWGMRENPDDDHDEQPVVLIGYQDNEKRSGSRSSYDSDAQYIVYQRSNASPSPSGSRSSVSTAHVALTPMSMSRQFGHQTPQTPEFAAWEHAVSRPWSPQMSLSLLESTTHLDPPPTFSSSRSGGSRRPSAASLHKARSQSFGRPSTLSRPPRLFLDSSDEEDEGGRSSAEDASPRFLMHVSRRPSLQDSMFRRNHSLGRINPSSAGPDVHVFPPSPLQHRPPMGRQSRRPSTAPNPATPSRRTSSMTAAPSQLQQDSTEDWRRQLENAMAVPQPTTPRRPHRGFGTPAFEIHESPRWL